MTEKRFEATYFDCQYVTDRLEHKDYPVLSEFEYANDLCNLLNELYGEIQRLNELINLIADAHSYRKEESVRGILRHEIWAIDTVAGESAQAWNEYCILSKFFKEHYGEHWDNED